MSASPSSASATPPAPPGIAGLVPPIFAGIIAAIIGFGSSFAIVVGGVTAVGATPAEATSGLMAVSLVMGVLGILLSLHYRMPISVAWSTPGAALMATTGALPGGFPEAIGAFAMAGAMIVAAGLIRPLGRLVAAIPPALAAAMLAGILLQLVLAPFRALQPAPIAVLAIIATWIVVGRFARLYAVPAAVAVTALLVAFLPGAGGELPDHPLIVASWVTPLPTWGGFVGLAVPLFVVTMASQNIPGLAVLAAHGYRPPAGPLMTATGIATILVAPLGAVPINLAAITAAMCAGADASPDPGRRWIAGVANGVSYIVIGIAASFAVALVTVSPPMLIQAAAGLALVGAFGNALVRGLHEPPDRNAVLVTFLLAGSGISVAGIGSAFWGLIAGLVITAIEGRLFARSAG
jgi:benzoate membrane transport protein